MAHKSSPSLISRLIDFYEIHIAGGVSQEVQNQWKFSPCQIRRGKSDKPYLQRRMWRNQTDFATDPKTKCFTKSELANIF